MMDIDSEHLGIPEQDYSAVVCMPAAEFQVSLRNPFHSLTFTHIIRLIICCQNYSFALENLP